MAGANPVGERLFEELLAVHDVIRRDLRALGDALAAGREARRSDLEGALASIDADGALWELRRRCLGHCRFVLGHHAVEDQLLFPAVAESPRVDPEILGRLESEHHEIAKDVAAFAEAARSSDDDERGLDALRRALEVLTGDVLSHLEFEEAALRPVMSAWATPPWES